MTAYDPDTAPSASDWLVTDESERVALVEAYHRLHGIEHPQAKLHAPIHTVVENQIALNEPAVVETLERLQAEGLTRHDAVHSIGAVVVEHLVDVFKSRAGASATPATAYLDRLRSLTADEWRQTG